jgi:hypothetical protein
MDIVSIGREECVFHGDLYENLYMEHHPGYDEVDPRSTVLKLKKAIYGLK